ncbi:hypothetical protein V1511DRAFT_506658 [Dipodascopsis uninucleata]
MSDFANALDSIVTRSFGNGLKTLSCPFSRFGRFDIGARQTILTVQSSEKLAEPFAVVISPLPFTEESAKALGSLTVKYIVSPNLVHFMGINDWKEKFPDAKIIGSDLLQSKAKSLKHKVDIPLSEAHGNKLLTPADLRISDIAEGELKFVYFANAQSRELVVYHGPSKSIATADMLFNMPCIEQYSASSKTPNNGFFLSWILKTFNAYDNLNKSLPAMMISDKKKKYKGGIKALSSLDFDKIIVCHGETMVIDAKKRFLFIFRDHL